MTCSGGDLASLDFNFDCEDAVACVLCDEKFEVNRNSQLFLTHLLKQHKLIIGTVDEVADLRQYVLYWRKLYNSDLSEYCIVWVTNSEPGAKHLSEIFYLLSDKLPEDLKLRNTLREMMLKYLTNQKEYELSNASFSRQCIYCSKVVTGGLANCFHHLTFDHGFSLGNPDNIIFGDKLLDILQEKLKSLQCLCCEKVFKNHVILREHMRKKQHRCLNPTNKMYDKFYILNHLKPGVQWEDAKRDLDRESEGSENGGSRLHRRFHEDQLWGDWREEHLVPAKCLFCNFMTTKVPQGIFLHMTVHHNFDFENITRNLSFYQKVKLVNYIRTKISELSCIGCDATAIDLDELHHHMETYQHSKLPSNSLWDQLRYHYPVVENDGILYHLQDNDIFDTTNQNINGSSTAEIVLPEDFPGVSASILKDQALRNEIIDAEVGPLDFTTMCLFCRYTSCGASAQARLFTHMASIHCFDFIEVVKDLSFYNQVKLINYIRWNTSKEDCYVCGEHIPSITAMEEHRVWEGHNTLPSQHTFDSSRWLRPVLEDDGLLQTLREDGDSDDGDDDHDEQSTLFPKIIGEEIRIPHSILQNEDLRQEILREIPYDFLNYQNK